MKLDTILVPLDGSSLAEVALPTATELAGSSGARLLLLRAAEAHTLVGADETMAQTQIRVVREAEEYLARVKERLAASGVKKIDTSVWYGSPASAIVEAAKTDKVGLIIMTSHGRSGFGRLIMGSVAESVMRGTTTPILLLRDAKAPVEAAKGEAAPWAARG